MSVVPLKLIVGLGNPGAQYVRTRHNAGFWFVDALSLHYHGVWRSDRRQHSELAPVRIGEAELWLLKPTTFMNLSGAAVAAVANFYRFTPDQILVVHDEIDLPPGVARLKLGGGAGGHNGVRDVITHIGAEFWRLRLGVGHPGSREQVIGFVLRPAAAAEEQLIQEAMGRALEVMPLLLSEGPQKAMHRLHVSAPKEPNEN